MYICISFQVSIDKNSKRIHKVVEIKVFLTFFLVNGRIRIREAQKRTDPRHNTAFQVGSGSRNNGWEGKKMMVAENFRIIGPIFQGRWREIFWSWRGVIQTTLQPPSKVIFHYSSPLQGIVYHLPVPYIRYIYISRKDNSVEINVFLNYLLVNGRIWSRIRIRTINNDSVSRRPKRLLRCWIRNTDFDKCFGGSGFGIRIRIQESKNVTHKNMRKVKKFHVLNWWMFPFEDWRLLQ